MFSDLRTSTKLFILCATFIISVGVPVVALVAEKRIAIDFARKELVGSRYLATVRDLYGSLFLRGPQSSADKSRSALADAEARAGGMGHTADLVQALQASLQHLWSSPTEDLDAPVTEVLQGARALAQRIGDDSNLALDPDLDSYYLQSVVVKKVPDFFGRLWDLHRVMRFGTKAEASIAESLLRSSISDTSTDLAAAYRGSSDGGLERALTSKVAAMATSVDAYLESLKVDTAAGDAALRGSAALRAVTEAAMETWRAAHSELDRLLQRRIDGLLGRMQFSLLLIGSFVSISLLMAMLTYRGIARPLQRLEAVASAVRETKDYSLRAEHKGSDEIGRVTVAINDMLSELAAARLRETAMQLQFARDTRLTTMGEMAASIAHEVNQPLAAIVANSSAGLRWLGNTPPDLSKLHGVLQSIAKDGHRASQVIGSVRAVFNKDVQDLAAIDLAGAVREVLELLWAELESERVSVQVICPDDLPPVWANRVQLQQVVSNLVMNAIDAMRPIVDRPRHLVLRAERQHPDDVVLMVEDSGSGIEPKDIDRVFDAFFTTKARGLGLGLAICRSIIEAHGGRLWATPNTPHGTIFHVQLPTSAAGP